MAWAVMRDHLQQIVNLSSNDIKNGMAIEMDGAPYKVVGVSSTLGLVA